jgi:hypothetical protein
MIDWLIDGVLTSVTTPVSNSGVVQRRMCWKDDCEWCLGKELETGGCVLLCEEAIAITLHTTVALGVGGERRYSSYSSTSVLDGSEWSASRPGRSLAPGKGSPIPIGQKAGWAPEPVWTQRLEEKSFRLLWASNLDRPVVQPVSRHYTELPRLENVRRIPKYVSRFSITGSLTWLICLNTNCPMSVYDITSKLLSKRWLWGTVFRKELELLCFIWCWKNTYLE